MDNQNICPSCKEEPKKVSKSGRLGYYCLECERKAAAKWRNNNHPSRLLSYARSRCKKSGLECTLKKEDIIIPEVCPVLGITIECDLTGKARDSSPSLHRIDSSKGYTKENVLVCSWRANNLLSDMTLEEANKVLIFLSH